MDVTSRQDNLKSYCASQEPPVESQVGDLRDGLVKFRSTYFGIADPAQERQFLAAHGRFIQKLTDVTTVLGRYIVADQAHKDWIKFIFDPAKRTRDGKVALDKVMILKNAGLQKLAGSVSLDYEDFFIHSKILMDRLAYLTKFLLKPIPAHMTFVAHRTIFP